MVPLTKDNGLGNTMNKINELVKSSTTNITDNKHYNDPIQKCLILEIEKSLIDFNIHKYFDEFCGATNGVINNYSQIATGNDQILGQEGLQIQLKTSMSTCFSIKWKN